MLQHTVPADVDTRIWNGTPDPALLAWLGEDGHHFDGTQLVIHTTDGDLYPEPGWTLVRWPDNDLSVMSPRAAVKRLAPGARATASPDRTQTKLLGMVVETDPSIPPGTVEIRPATSCTHPGPHPGFTCAEVDQTRPFWAGRWDEMDQSTYERLKQEWTARHANDPEGAAHVVELPQPPQNTATVGTLRKQLAEAIGRTNLLVWPEAKRLAAADAVLALILPGTRITAELARDAEATVQRVIALYEQWVKDGAPPLGTSLSRWWDRRLVELRDAVLDRQVEVDESACASPVVVHPDASPQAGAPPMVDDPSGAGACLPRSDAPRQV
ncbi:hypothetical protein PV569_13100 [Streptomyces scabiei]|uniref:hypothetical protein n=1 Tax=Streptomyces scabiei TaxID=1930 RepID=UPI0029BE73F8|nr:hypothetical protein [Streptomyces scabiei]MDX3294644.1 hypothetical protein [Streptomyces scabiei]